MYIKEKNTYLSAFFEQNGCNSKIMSIFAQK